jgi:hypothetical protein
MMENHEGKIAAGKSRIPMRFAIGGKSSGIRKSS